MIRLCNLMLFSGCHSVISLCSLLSNLEMHGQVVKTSYRSFVSDFTI